MHAYAHPHTHAYARKSNGQMPTLLLPHTLIASTQSLMLSRIHTYAPHTHFYFIFATQNMDRDETWVYYENMRGMSESSVLKLSRLLEPLRTQAPVEPSNSNTSLESLSSTATNSSVVSSASLATHSEGRVSGGSHLSAPRIALSPSGSLVPARRLSSAGSEADDASASSESSNHVRHTALPLPPQARTASTGKQPMSMATSPLPLPLASPKRFTMPATQAPLPPTSPSRSKGPRVPSLPLSSHPKNSN